MRRRRQRVSARAPLLSANGQGVHDIAARRHDSAGAGAGSGVDCASKCAEWSWGWDGIVMAAAARAPATGWCRASIGEGARVGGRSPAAGRCPADRQRASGKAETLRATGCRAVSPGCFGATGKCSKSMKLVALTPRSQLEPRLCHSACTPAESPRGAEGEQRAGGALSDKRVPCGAAIWPARKVGSFRGNRKGRRRSVQPLCSGYDGHGDPRFTPRCRGGEPRRARPAASNALGAG